MDNLDGLIERLRTTRLLSQRNQLALQEEAATTLETLTRENARLREAGWRDIESAPKDGSAFLVWADGFEWPEVIRWYAHDADLAEEAGEDDYFHYAEEAMHDQFDWEHEVEYWMPLPPAPAKSDLEAK